MSLASARDLFASRGCSRRRSHEAARALTALARPAEPAWDTKSYRRAEDPFGREPMLPTLANPIQLWAGEPQPVPFVPSNDISTFSILDTGKVYGAWWTSFQHTVSVTSGGTSDIEGPRRGSLVLRWVGVRCRAGRVPPPRLHSQ